MSEPRPSGHPKGLYVLFATEMWERFNYYGMRAVLVYFMTDALLFSKPFASNLYGGYTSLVFLTPLVGGYMADRYWGNRRSILFGGIVMALGELILFICGSIYSSNPGLAGILFYTGLGTMIAGNGFFKPNISSMVGQLYPEGDKRLDSAYTLFYIGINVGGMLGPFICGMVGVTGNPADFKWGFLVAGIGMLISVITLKYLQDRYIVTPEGKAVGVTPDHMANSSSPIRHPFSIAVAAGLAALVALVATLMYLHSSDVFDLSWILIGSLAVILWVIFSDKALTKVERQRIITIFIVSFFVVFFWSAYEQTGASLAFFAKEQTDLHIDVLNFDVNPSWFQSINSFYIIIFAPVFAWIWLKLGQRDKEPSSPKKMALGLLLLGLGYLWIAYGVKGNDPSKKVTMIWLTVMYALHTFGELCLSPIGLSLVNKLAPLRFASLLMAVWFMANAGANVLTGKLSALYPPGMQEIVQAKDKGVDLAPILAGRAPSDAEVKILTDNHILYTYHSFMGITIHNLYEFFMLFVVLSGVAALLLFVLTWWLEKMMHGKR